VAARFDPASYLSWFRSPLGEAVWADERRALALAIGPVSGLRILEAGTGDGRYAVELQAAGASVVGLDRSAAMLDAARARGRAGTAKPEWRQGDLRALPFRFANLPVSSGRADGW
jgi:ubiquinone/menaquinone biosynthesis C-methylase UbiE